MVESSYYIAYMDETGHAAVVLKEFRIPYFHMDLLSVVRNPAIPQNRWSRLPHNMQENRRQLVTNLDGVSMSLFHCRGATT